MSANLHTYVHILCIHVCIDNYLSFRRYQRYRGVHRTTEQSVNLETRPATAKTVSFFITPSWTYFLKAAFLHSVFHRTQESWNKMAIKKSPPVVHFTAKMDKILHKKKSYLHTFLFNQACMSAICKLLRFIKYRAYNRGLCYKRRYFNYSCVVIFSFLSLQDIFRK